MPKEDKRKLATCGTKSKKLDRPKGVMKEIGVLNRGEMSWNVKDFDYFSINILHRQVDRLIGFRSWKEGPALYKSCLWPGQSM